MVDAHGKNGSGSTPSQHGRHQLLHPLARVALLQFAMHHFTHHAMPVVFPVNAF